MTTYLLTATYQNFYLNDNGIICGIISPREIFKITEPKELLNCMAARLEKELKFGNYEYNKTHMTVTQERQAKAIKRLSKLINSTEMEG